MWSWMRDGAAQPLWWGESGLWHAPHGADAGATCWDSFDAWCAAHAGARARLWLSAWWVVDVLVDAALPLHHDAELLAHARALLQHYHGDAAAPWPLAAWQAGASRGVSALHGQNLDALRTSAARHGVVLQAVQPWWARALRLALDHEPTLAREPAAQLLLVEGRLVTRLDLRRGSLAGLQQRRLREATPAALQHWLAEEPVALQRCLGYGLATAPQARRDDLPVIAPSPEAATLGGACPPLWAWAGASRGARWLPRWAGLRHGPHAARPGLGLKPAAEPLP